MSCVSVRTGYVGGVYVKKCGWKNASLQDIGFKLTLCRCCVSKHYYLVNSRENIYLGFNWNYESASSWGNNIKAIPFIHSNVRYIVILI